MKSRITIDTIAKSCGVSKMAVSFALRGSNQISGVLRERILLKADQLGYVPSRAARSLNGVATPRIAIVLPVPGVPAHARNLQAFDKACRERDVETVVRFHYWHAETERKILRSLFDDGITGLILSPAAQETHETLRHLQNTGLSVPFVSLGYLHDPESVLEKYLGNYSPDTQAVSTLCLEHLTRLGHRNIAFLFQGPQTSRATSAQLAANFLAASKRISGARLELFYLDDSSSPIRQKILRGEPCELEDLIQTDDQLAVHFLDHLSDTTVAITSDDLAGLSLLNECHRRKIDVPNTISIFSLGGSAICRMAALPLAHAAVDMAEVANHVVSKLLAGPMAKWEEYNYRLSIVGAATLANRALGSFPYRVKSSEIISPPVSQKRRRKHESKI